MVQSSREVTRLALEFAGPERIPIEDLASPDDSDIVLVGSAPQYWNWWEVSPGIEQCIDENGCLRQRLEGKSIGEIVTSPIQDWDGLRDLSFPPVPDSWRDDTAREIRRYQDKYIMGDLGAALYTVVDLRGIHNFFLDTVLYPEQLSELLDIVLERKLSRIREYASFAGIDAVAWYDDWGTQDRLLISPESWRSLFKPRYAAMVEEAHRCGFHAYWHCCGNIWEIIPDLVEIGVDILNIDQPILFGIRRLGEAFSGKLCFCCPVDIQATLPKGDKDLAKDEAALLIQSLGSQNGGFIGKSYPGADSELGISPDVVSAYLDVFRGYSNALPSGNASE